MCLGVLQKPAMHIRCSQKHLRFVLTFYSAAFFVPAGQNSTNFYYTIIYRFKTWVSKKTIILLKNLEPLNQVVRFWRIFLNGFFKGFTL
jgi:hypothetical protein